MEKRQSQQTWRPGGDGAAAWRFRFPSWLRPWKKRTLQVGIWTCRFSPHTGWCFTSRFDPNICSINQSGDQSNFMWKALKAHPGRSQSKRESNRLSCAWSSWGKSWKEESDRDREWQWEYKPWCSQVVVLVEPEPRPVQPVLVFLQAFNLKQR